MTSKNHCDYHVDESKVDSLDEDWECPIETWKEHDFCVWHVSPRKKTPDDIAEKVDDRDQVVVEPLFTGMNLKDISFKGYDFIAADFYDGSLQEVVFEGVGLEGANFDAQKISDVEFVNCNLDKATFNEETNIKNSLFEGGTHDSVEFMDTDFQNSRISETTFYNSIIFNVDISQLGGEEIRFDGGRFELVTLYDPKSPDITLSGISNGEIVIRFGELNSLTLEGELEKMDVKLRSVGGQMNIEEKVGLRKLDVAGCSNFSLLANFQRIRELTIQDTQGEVWQLESGSVDDVYVDDLSVKSITIADIKCNSPHIKKISAANQARIEEVVLTDGSFKQVSLTDAEIVSLNCSEMDMDELDIREGLVSQFDISGGSMRSAILDDVDVQIMRVSNGTDLNGAKLRRISYAETFDLGNLEMQNTRLKDAELGSVDFAGCNLEGAALGGADLRGADLRDAQLHDAHLNDVRLNSDTSLGDKCIYERRADRKADDASKVKINNNNRWGKPILAANRLITRLTAGDEWKSDNAQTLKASARVYREYQDVLRANSLPNHIRGYRIREKDTRRKLALVDQQSSFWSWLRFSFQRWGIQYGERYRNLIVNSGLVILICSMLYLQVGGISVENKSADIVVGHNTIIRDLVTNFAFYAPFISPSGLHEVLNSIYFSVVTFTTLGYGDMQPASDTARFVAGIESLIGAAMMAILVFIIGRRATW